MRLWVVFIFLSTTCLGQSVLPSFESSYLTEINVEQTLFGQPKAYSIEVFNYNRDSARLFKSEISSHYYFQNTSLIRVEFQKAGKAIKTYLFDSLGRIQEQLRTDDFESIPRITYSYNEETLTSEEIVYRITGTVHSRIVLRYNDQGLVIAKEEYRGKDQLNRYWLYEYNEQMDLIHETYFDLSSRSDEPTNQMEKQYTYDSEARIIEIKTRKDEALESSTEFRYFPDSLIQETLVYQSRELPVERQVEIRHDSARVLVKGYFNTGDTTSYRSRFKEIYIDGDLVEYESRTLRGTFVDRYATFYEYDYRGNWIKKTTYSNGITIKVEERRIRY